MTTIIFIIGTELNILLIYLSLLDGEHHVDRKLNGPMLTVYHKADPVNFYFECDIVAQLQPKNNVEHYELKS